MKTFLKAVVAGGTPALVVTCAMGAGIVAGGPHAGADMNKATPHPSDVAGTQPSTQPATQPAPVPPRMPNPGFGRAGHRG
jgi:hypothetical protein